MSDRTRELLAATALTVALAAGLWMLGVGVDPHAVATTDVGDRVVAPRSLPSASKAAPRVLLAALGGPAHAAAAALAPTSAAPPAVGAPRSTRLYALLHVYRL